MSDVLIKAIKVMTEPNYIPKRPDEGMCSNVRFEIDIVLTGHLRARRPAHCFFESREAAKLFKRLGNMYATLNRVDYQYYIENSMDEYTNNKNKWEGRWREVRQEVARKFIQCLENDMKPKYLKGRVFYEQNNINTSSD